MSKLAAVPRRVRTDCGTENGVLAAMQCYFRRAHNDEYAGSRAHIFGSSHSNQRIEAWWLCLRRRWSNFVIDLFTEIVESGQYNTDDDLQKKLRTILLYQYITE